MNRAVIALAFAALAVLAGCSGGVSTGDANASVTTTGDAAEGSGPNASTGESANATTDGSTPSPGGPESDPGSTDPARKVDPATEDVPAKADYVVGYDSSLVTDPATNATVAHYFRATSSGDDPRSLRDYLGSLADDPGGIFPGVGLSPTAVESAVVFGEFPTGTVTSAVSSTGPDYSGAIVRANWSESTVLERLRANYDVTESEYAGTTLYLVDRSGGATLAYAHRGSGRHLLGTEAAVQDVIDVANGDAKPVSDELRRAYGATLADGHVRFAVAIPEEVREKWSRGRGAMLDVEKVTHVAGAYYTAGGQSGTLGIELSLYATGEDAARSLGAQVDGLFAMGKGAVENETVAAQLDEISVATEGDRVVVTYEVGVGTAQTLVDYLATSGDSEASEQVPALTVEFEHDGGTVTAYHGGGDTVSAENLRARCGSAGVPVEGGTLRAGDVILETDRCPAGSQLQVVWVSEAGRRTVLAAYDVPEGRVVPSSAGVP